ncbi:MAG: hypothetical protein IJQ29_05455 [Synergistaceae bacterium]|nr:hypothetical protein [Synergistaceae bacterium]MBQ6909543.1 hypothetical protein [Synergistaceae bacterium]
MAYDLTDLITTAQLKKLATRTKAELDLTIRTVLVDGNTINFYNEKNATNADTAAFSVDFPSEFFLDQAATTLVQNFAFNAVTYPGATDPSLDGKQVLVLGVKTQTAAGTSSVAYSFVDLTSLIEVVEIASGDSAKVLSIAESGKTRTISVHISQTAGNMLSVENDGLYVTTRVTGATENNLAAFDANGAPSDSGIAKANVQQKVTGAVANNIATFNANGFVQDSGVAIATDSEIDEMVLEVFGAAV